MTVPRAEVMLFTSLKTYFGYEQTREWIQAVARIVDEVRESNGLSMELAVFPDVAASSGVAALLSDAGIALGAQDVAADETGPQTGEVSALVLSEIGCTFAEIGHAERRYTFGESDELIARKVANAVEHGLVPLICVGETTSGQADAAEFCVRELHAALALLDDSAVRTRVVVAYEPVWAIGAAESAPLEHVVDVVGALRRAVDAHPAVSQSQVIYGGSAGPATVAQLGSAIDGLFLGRSVHDPAELRRVIEAYTAQVARGDDTTLDLTPLEHE